jgi:hypothetical protein
MAQNPSQTMAMAVNFERLTKLFRQPHGKIRILGAILRLDVNSSKVVYMGGPEG